MCLRDLPVRLWLSEVPLDNFAYFVEKRVACILFQRHEGHHQVRHHGRVAPAAKLGRVVFAKQSLVLKDGSELFNDLPARFGLAMLNLRQVARRNSTPLVDLAKFQVPVVPKLLDLISDRHAMSVYLAISLAFVLMMGRPGERVNSGGLVHQVAVVGARGLSG